LTNLTYGTGGASDESSQTFTYTLTGIPAFINVFQADGTTAVTSGSTLTLTQLQGLKYKTVANANGSGSLTWTVQDSGGTANGGVDTLNQSLAITVTPVNDQPVQTGTAPSAINVFEDSSNTSATSLGLSGLAYSSGGGSDETSQTFTYTVTGIPGFIHVFKADGTTQISANTALSLSELQGLTYKTITNASGSGSLTWTVQDSGGTSNGGVNSLSQSLSITVSGDNDAPVITGGPVAVGLTETNAALTSSGSLTVSDADLSDTVSVSRTLAVSGSSRRADPAAPSDAALLTMFSVSPNPVLTAGQASNSLTWSFNSGSTTFDYLAQGETLVLTYTVTATDNNPTPASGSTTVTLTITGSNDGPTISVQAGDNATANLSETNTGLKSSFSLTVEDKDTTNTVASTITGLNISGTYGNIAGLNNSTYLSYLSTNFIFQSGILQFTADNAAEVYLNGNLIGSTNNWGRPYTFTGLNVKPGANVLAVLAWDVGSIAAMSGKFTMPDGTSFGTSNIAGWKVFNADPVPTTDYQGNSGVRSTWNLPAGWNTVGFDDSDSNLWRTPQDTRTVETWYPWGNQTGDPAWIWWGTTRNELYNTDVALFRYTFTGSSSGDLLLSTENSRRVRL
jgi:VCBS repeat-containing protein